MDVNIPINPEETDIFTLQSNSLRNDSFVSNMVIKNSVRRVKAAELRSDRHTAFQSPFSNIETACTQRIQMRSFWLIHSLFMQIVFFELELRFVSSLMIMETSGGPGTFSAFLKEEELPPPKT